MKSFLSSLCFLTDSSTECRSNPLASQRRTVQFALKRAGKLTLALLTHISHSYKHVLLPLLRLTPPDFFFASILLVNNFFEASEK